MNPLPGRNDACPCGSGKKFKKCCGDRIAETRPDMSLDALVGLFHAGRFAELEDAANKLLQSHPNLGMVWKLLGTAQGIQGKDALPALQKAVQFLPDDPVVRNNLGNALQAVGRVNEALTRYREALSLAPDYADAHNNLGNASQALGDLDRAAASHRRACELRPQDAEFHNNLGVDLKMLGQLDAAAACYERALALAPSYAEACNNLANVRSAQGQAEQAIDLYRRALALKPEYVEAHNNLGVALQTLGNDEAALACYRQALALRPTYAEAYNNLGYALQDIGRFEAAIDAYREALRLNPAFAAAHNNLGSALQEVGRFSEAVDCFRRALALDPNMAGAHNNLGTVDDFRQALLLEPDYLEARSNVLFAQNFSPDVDRETRLAEAREYGRIARAKAVTPYTDWRCDAEPTRLRVGMVSGDFQNHPVGYFLESLLAQLNPARIELIAYPTKARRDELTRRIQPCFRHWRPIYGLNDRDAAARIHDDGLHLLLDLSGHTNHNRLPVFAYKPAPVQASWLGYFATTGVAEIDYLLADRMGVPEDRQDWFTERIWYLPDTRLCFTPPMSALKVSRLPALEQGPNFGCCQNLAKIGDPVLRAWSQILSALPTARLSLASKQLGDAQLAAQFQARLQRHGIDLMRLSLRGAMPREQYLAHHASIDIMLDTFPYPGGTTTCEALWMGVPTVTLAGDTLLARQGASLLQAAGLADWIAGDADAYVAKAVAAAQDLPRLARLRADLRPRLLASPLCDAPRFARHFEAALWGMWQAYRGVEIRDNAPI